MQTVLRCQSQAMKKTNQGEETQADEAGLGVVCLTARETQPTLKPAGTLCTAAPPHLAVGWVPGSKAFLCGDDTGRQVGSSW